MSEAAWFATVAAMPLFAYFLGMAYGISLCQPSPPREAGDE